MLTDALQFIRPSREYRELAVLSEVGRNTRVSQRGLARAASVSATMINAYIDDLVVRGYLDVTGDTNRTYQYRLTPEGQKRQEALLAGISREVSALYHQLEERLTARLEEHRRSGVRRVALWGDPQSAPLVEAAARRAGLEVVSAEVPVLPPPDAMIVLSETPGEAVRKFESAGGRILRV